VRDGDARLASGGSIDELLDRAVAAINRGDRAVAEALAGQVLAVDRANPDAEVLLTSEVFGGGGTGGEIRRLTILFADLVDSTALSTRVEPETYRLIVGHYRQQVLRIVERFEGHVGSTKGDGLLAVFGHPTAHEDDVRRAVAAGLEITREVTQLSEAAQRRFGIEIQVRVGVHRGLVYLDTAQDDVYGLAANLAARVSGLAPPGSVVVSEAVSPLIDRVFELEARPPTAVKGIADPVAHHRVVAERAEPVKINRGPLVGRDRELARLQKSWARAQAGTLTTPGVVFRGEPGIGKSRLAAAASELVETSGGVVLELAGSLLHTDVGLHPVRTLIERRCGIGRRTNPQERLRLLDAEVCACSRNSPAALPLLAPVLGIAPEHGYQPVPAEGRRLQELIAEAVTDYLLPCLGDGPGLLVAEDVHWFDPSTIEVLGSLLRGSEGRLLIVITGRDGGWLPDDWPVKVFDLAPLTDEQTDTLIVALDPTVTDQQRAAVRDRCDGVPFYIEQVVAGLRMTPGQAGDAPAVPEAVYEPLFARLRASANIVPVVEAAAVIGRNIDRLLLLEMVDLDEDVVDDVIDELEDAAVFEPYGTDGWRFRHELLREVAAELAPPSVRRALHSKVADALVGGAGGEPDSRLAAAHYERAERFEEAASAYQQAAADARRRGALEEARSYLTRALTQLESCPPGRDRDRLEMALRLRRGFLSATAESYTRRAALDDFERCLQLGGTDLHDDELVATLVALTSFYAVRADLRRAERVLKLLQSGLGEGRRWFRTEIEASLGWLSWARGDFDRACREMEAAVTVGMAEEQPEIDAVRFVPDEPIGAVLVHLAWGRLVQGDLTGAEVELARAARWIERLDFPQGPFMHDYALFMDCWMCIESGQLERAAVVSAEMIEQAERHDFDLWRLIAATQRTSVKALASLAADDLDPAELSAHIEALTGLLDTWHTIELNLYRTFFDGVLSRLLTAAGQPKQARARLDEALQLAQDTGMHFYDAELLRLRARTHTDPDARRGDVNAALELARQQGATLFELRAAVDDFELRGEQARAVLRDAVERMRVYGAWPELARARAALEFTSRAAGGIDK
jgi:class 3 adenylate cyclase/tetratricopeptide (TPR) repeat protein